MWSLIFLACPKIDQQAVRQDDKEQVALQASAERYWLGVRWGEPNRVMEFIEDPLEKARFAAELEDVEYVDVKVLHAELDSKPEEEPSNDMEIWRTGKVYVRVEQIDTGNVLQITEDTQLWYRTSDGWYVDTKKEVDSGQQLSD